MVTKNRAGFQSSETTSAEVTLYSFGDDPVFRNVAGARTLTGRARGDADDAIAVVMWSKGLGQPCGTFSIQVKANSRTSWLRQIVDDDWVDITFVRNNRRYHHCRGLIDTIRESTAVVNGATQRVWNITGRDHGKVWLQSQVYFNHYMGELARGVYLRAAKVNDAIYGNVAKTVRYYLLSFLADIQDQNQSIGAIWTMPPGIPGVEAGSFVTDALKLIETAYTDQPERIALNPFLLDPSNNNLWNLAQQYSDPTFCELYTEIVDRAYLDIPRSPEVEEFPPEDTTIAVIIRDRPLPFGDDVLASPWFQLPMTTMAIQETDTGIDIGRGGEDRFNAWFVRGKPNGENSGKQVHHNPPIVDIEDIRRHGLRRLDVSSEYIPPSDNWPRSIAFQRAQIRDWHCLNPYFYNGVIPFARGVPELRAGTRLRLLGESGSDEDITFYVEGLTHAWTARGMKTIARVSRGWVGTDESYAQALSDVRSRHSVITGTSFNPKFTRSDGSFSGDLV